MYHWEADQEDFLVLSGEALLIIEGEERPLRQWDFVHCPPETKHMIVGAGDGPCVVLAVGAREHQDSAGWGGYTVDEAALRHGAGVEQETTEADEAYARFQTPSRRDTGRAGSQAEQDRRSGGHSSKVAQARVFPPTTELFLSPTGSSDSTLAQTRPPRPASLLKSAG